MKRFFAKILISIITSLIMLPMLASTVFAEGLGSVVIRLSEADGVSIPERETKVHVYAIADYTDGGQLAITADFIESKIELTDLFAANARQMNDIAHMLQEYTKEHKLDGEVTDARVGTDIKLSIDNDGVYLILVDEIASQRYKCDFAPMICQMPSHIGDGTIDCDFEISPKYSVGNADPSVTVTTSHTVTSDTDVLASTLPTDSSTATTTILSTTASDSQTMITSTIGTVTSTATTTIAETEDKLPQTGTRLWVVYVFAGIGAIILITVWGMCRSETSCKGTKISMIIVGGLCAAAAVGLYTEPIFVERASVPIMSQALTELRGHRGELTPIVTQTSTEVQSAETTATGCIQAIRTETTTTKTASQPTYEFAGNSYIGVLEIPEIGLEVPVADNCSMSTLRSSPGCYYGSAETENIVIGAHNYKSHFGYIYTLSSGSNVSFTDVNGKVYSYYVTEVTELSPYSSQTVCTSGHDLAMFTCNSSGARRVVVYCDIIS